MRSRHGVVTAVVILIVLIAAAGCANSPRAFGVHGKAEYGYRVRPREVVFEFDPQLYEHVTTSIVGDWTLTSAHGIETVAVAGEFNDWDPVIWQMRRLANGRFELRRPLRDLSKRSKWEFKFVVNEDQWVEPPPAAANRVSTGFANRAFNLRMDLASP